MTVSQDVTAKIDEALKVLTAKKKEWAQLPLEKKVELLDVSWGCGESAKLRTYSQLKRCRASWLFQRVAP